MEQRIVISGTGLWTPPFVLTNQELVSAFNHYVAQYNQQFAQEIAAGGLTALQPSSEEFIFKASSIEKRFVANKSGLTDPNIMQPMIPERSNDQLSLQAESAVAAARQALQKAGQEAAQVDMIVVACSNLQRPYPAIAIEVQNALGAQGFAFDLNVACSSAVFGLQVVLDTMAQRHSRCALLINPEFCTAQLNFRDRSSHFIFGDATTALLIEPEALTHSKDCCEIVSTKLITRFSNNIRNNGGFLNRCDPLHRDDLDKLFVQDGRKVFKEVIPMVIELIETHLQEQQLTVQDMKRFWLHQANGHMNRLIAEKLLGRVPQREEVPQILQDYGNTSSAGSVIAFHQYHADLQPGDLGLLCAFGAGYSAGSVILKKI